MTNYKVPIYDLVQGALDGRIRPLASIETTIDVTVDLYVKRKQGKSKQTYSTT